MQWLVLLRRSRYDKALEFVDKARELNPNEGEYLATWAKIQSALRDPGTPVADLILHLRRAEEVCARADAAGVKHMTFFNLRWEPDYRYFKELIDDGYVGECLKINGPYVPRHTKQSRSEMVFSFAKVWQNRKAKLLYLERKVHRSYSRMSTKHWAETEVKSRRGKRFIEAYVMNFMSGFDFDW